MSLLDNQVLAAKEMAVAERVVADEEAHRMHLVIALSGAHAYGFPSPDSDLDIKAVHIERTQNLLGLKSHATSFDRLEFVDGVEIDYTSNELRGVLVGVLAGNGNYIERIGGAHILHSTPEHQELRALMPTLLSRQVHRHYKGFAHSQRMAFENAEAPTAKKLLYVLRTALTGTHLLRTGELRVDLRSVAKEYGYGEAEALIAAKRQGEQALLSETDRAYWLPRLDSLFAGLEEAQHESVLPPNPPASAELEDWLVALRAKDLSGADLL